MNLAQVRPIVDAVLYEGYILYPYRPTSNKNRQRWTFGGVYPKAYFDATGGTDPYHMQTQCLVSGNADTKLGVRVRFLQPISREVGELAQPLDEWPTNQEPEFNKVSSLTLGDKQFHTWQEAMERDVALPDSSIVELLQQEKRLPFAFNDHRRELEPLQDTDGRYKGVLLHTQIDIQGHVLLSIETLDDGVYRLTVRIENHTEMASDSAAKRDQASLYSFASTHIILGVEHGDFVSLMDPPEELKQAALACENQGCYPVLVGQPGDTDTLLCSPITLYDHPEIAPESPGDLYDGTEIDEILSLNILAMTDEEKREMAATDPRAAALLERTEALNGDDFLRLHGILRDTQSVNATPAGSPPVDASEQASINPMFAGRSSFSAPDQGPNPLEPTTPPEPRGPQLAYYSYGSLQLKVGDRVRLNPKGGGDVLDLVLKGMDAVIEGIERDFEDRIHVAVALDADPGREWGLQKMPGHRFFFSPEELQPLQDQDPPQKREAQV